MSTFPENFPIAECQKLINSVRSEQPISKQELIESAWIMQGFVLGQLCGTPTLTIGKQTKTDPIAALELAMQTAESGLPIKQANIPWAMILTWVLDIVRYAQERT